MKFSWPDFIASTLSSLPFRFPCLAYTIISSNVFVSPANTNVTRFIFFPRIYLFLHTNHLGVFIHPLLSIFSGTRPWLSFFILPPFFRSTFYIIVLYLHLYQHFTVHSPPLQFHLIFILTVASFSVLRVFLIFFTLTMSFFRRFFNFHPCFSLSLYPASSSPYLWVRLCSRSFSAFCSLIVVALDVRARSTI